jgi:hypothetical protein
MLLVAARELVCRRTASLLALAGLVTATIGFVVLASTSQTTQAQLTGDIGSAWKTPYDILVRPRAAASELERRDGLVTPNFLSSSPRGITLDQLSKVRAVAGVAVAAPIAIVGTVQFGMISPAILPVDLTTLLPDGGIYAFRTSATAIGDGGTSRYPLVGSSAPVVVAAMEGVYDFAAGTLTVGKRQINCRDLRVSCFARTAINCPAQATSCMGFPGLPIPGLKPDQVGSFVYFPVPMTIAGIDPVAEEQLSPLSACLRSGRHLLPTDAPKPSQNGEGGPGIPILAANTALLDESVDVKVARADGAGLAAGKGADSLAWSDVGKVSIDANVALSTFLAAHTGQFPNLSPIWTPGPVQYELAGSMLTLQPVPPDLEAYSNPLVPEASLEQIAPAEANDTWFRRLDEHPRTTQGTSPANTWQVVGTFDPTCLPAFDSKGAGQLSTYSPASVTTSAGHQLGAGRNLASFLDRPPLLLTTLAGAQYFADPRNFKRAPGDRFITAIRVKVAGADSPGPASQNRLTRIAADIQEESGLDVDIVKGSSPQAIQIAVPAGNFGRPAMVVSQGWSAKGLAFRFFRAVTAQNLAIFSVVLVAALTLVAQTAYVSVRRRRHEFGVLLAIGWPQWRVVALVELEMLILGVAAGLVGIVLGAPALLATNQIATWWNFAAVLPLAIGISLLAGLLPALMVGRGSTRQVMDEPRPLSDRFLPRSPFLLGMRTVFDLRWDARLGIAVLALGGALLGLVVLIAVAFQGALDSSILGTYLSARVRPFHLIVVGVTLLVGALAVAEVLTIGYLERRQHLASLRACGWAASQVAVLMLGEAVGLGLGAVAFSLAVPVTVGALLGAGPQSLAASGLASAGMCLLATAIAALAPTMYAYSASVARALRGE